MTRAETTTHYIVCNGPGCANWCDGDTVEHAEQQAIEEGWQLGRADHCPNHKTDRT